MHTFTESTVDPEFIGSIDCEASDSYMQFRGLLEDNNIMEWPFLFGDISNHCSVNPKLEPVNKVRADVYVIANEGIGGLGSKRRQYENGGFSSKSHKKIFPLLSIQHFDPNNCNDDIVMATVVDSS